MEILKGAGRPWWLVRPFSHPLHPESHGKAVLFYCRAAPPRAASRAQGKAAQPPRGKREQTPRAPGRKKRRLLSSAADSKRPPKPGGRSFLPQNPGTGRHPGAVRAKPAGPQRVRWAAAAQGTKSGLSPSLLCSGIRRAASGFSEAVRPALSPPRFPSKGRRRDVISGWNGQRFRVRMAMMMISEKKNRTAQHATPSARMSGFGCLDSGKQLHTFR